MLVPAVVAVVGLAIVAGSARPADGRAETAIALPLAAAVAAVSPAAGVALLAGAALAFATERAVQRRRLLYGRQLRAIAALAGAVVPLGTVLVASVLGATPPAPELWIAGAVVPGVLADDVHRQPPERRAAIAVGGVATFCALAISGIVLSGSLPTLSPETLLGGGGSAVGGAAAAETPLPALVAAIGAGAGAATLARWRYGLALGPVTLPLIAVWALDGPAVLVAAALAAAASGVAVAVFQPRLCLPTRQLAAAVGLLGALVGLAVGLGAGVGLPAVLVGALAAEDARQLRRHAGADLVDALALSGALVVPVAVVVALAGGVPIGVPTGLALALAVGVGGLVIARREHERPDEETLRRAERRWVP